MQYPRCLGREQSIWRRSDWDSVMHSPSVRLRDLTESELSASGSVAPFILPFCLKASAFSQTLLGSVCYCEVVNSYMNLGLLVHNFINSSVLQCCFEHVVN